MAHLWVGGALRDPPPPPSFLPPSRSPQPWGFSFPGWLVQQEDGSWLPSDLPAALVLWDPPERALPVSQWTPLKPSGHWQMKALGRSLQEPPFLQGCGWHSSVSAETGHRTGSYWSSLHVPRIPAAPRGLHPWGLDSGPRSSFCRLHLFLLGWYPARSQQSTLPSLSLLLLLQA